MEELTYEERIKWFIQNYYESGMEYESLLVSMKDENLDAIKWYDEIISIPKFKKEDFCHYSGLPSPLAYMKESTPEDLPYLKTNE